MNVGDKAPDFKLSDQFGKTHKLSDYRGQWVLLYFYPKDDTTGCTAEACAIRDNYSQFSKAGIVVIGVSVDSVKSHGKFASKYELPFTILADEQKEVVRLYGAWREKPMAGRKIMGTERMSLVINPDGKIVKTYEKVKPTEHAEEVLADIEKLKNS